MKHVGVWRLVPGLWVMGQGNYETAYERIDSGDAAKDDAMSEIVRCMNHGCPSRDTCRRYTAQTKAGGVFREFDPGDADWCRGFWPYGEGRQVPLPFGEAVNTGKG